VTARVVSLRHGAAARVVRLAADWARAHDAWLRCEEQPQEDQLYVVQSLLRAEFEVAARGLASLESTGNEHEPIPYMPNVLMGDLQSQIDHEAWERHQRGEHLIEVELDTGRIDAFGRRIFETALYLETNSP
jgi:hypothetical protein